MNITKMHFIFLLVGLILGWIAKGELTEEGEIEIKDVKISKTEWKVPKKTIKQMTKEESISHVSSEIMIEASIKDNKVYIHAHDSIKEAHAVIELEGGSGMGWKTKATFVVVLIATGLTIGVLL